MNARLGAFFFLLCGLAAVAPGALAQASPFAAPQGLLPVDEAFRLQAWMPDEQHLVVGVRIAPGHYLYRDKLSVAADTVRVRLGFPELPPAERIHDQFFGDTRIYRTDFTFAMPIAGALSQPFPLRLHYQGCSEKPAVCYPPQQRLVSVEPPGATAQVPQVPARTRPAPDAASLQESLAQRLEHSTPFWVLLSFLGLGLLLSLTPCVLPLLPVLAALVGGVGGGRRAFALSLVYVLSMSLAYAAAGVAAAAAGAGLQPWLQHPLVLGLTALLFAALALAMFGVAQLQLPLAVRGFFDTIARRQQRGSFSGAALLGLIGALVLSPCVSPPLVGALLYIGATGDVWVGGSALFLLGLGLGAPLLLFGTAAGRFLPSSGVWMETLRQGLGFLLLGMGVWLLGRVLPPPLPLLLFGLLFFAAGVWLWRALSHWAWRAAALGLLFWGVMLLQGAAVGGGSLLHPLRGLGAAGEAAPALFAGVEDRGALREHLRGIPADKRGAMLEVYADWCISCLEMEHRVFSQREVQDALGEFLLLRADLSQNSPEHRALLREFSLFGPPALLFFDRRGRELAAARLVGYVPAQELLAHLAAVFAREFSDDNLQPAQQPGSGRRL